MIAMIVGTLLALLALAYVLHPLLVESRGSFQGASERSAPSEHSAVDALREIEFDKATGKLSDSDYSALKNSYTQRAVAELRAADSPRAVCPNCGPRPEGDALFCSNCGTALTRPPSRASAPTSAAGST